MPTRSRPAPRRSISRSRRSICRRAARCCVSPITDPGTLSAIILNGLQAPALRQQARQLQCRGRAGSRAARPECIGHHAGPRRRASSGSRTRSSALARARGMKLIEDCSQSHGARIVGRPIGTFGDIAAFSTMYRKAHMTGPSGGVVYTRDLDLYRQALAHADRGKPRWRDDFSDRDPAGYLFPALNHNTDEISCAIGIASLGRLADTITAPALLRLGCRRGPRRLRRMYAALTRHSPTDSPFVYPVIVDPGAHHLQQDRIRRGGARRKESTSIRTTLSSSMNGRGSEPVSRRRLQDRKRAQHPRPLVQPLSQRDITASAKPKTRSRRSSRSKRRFAK